MEKKHPFLEAVCRLSVPVALQSMLQSSFSMVDQVMVGRLGSVSVAGVGFAGKFSSLFSVLTAAIGSAAGILISQYLGQNSGRGVRRSFFESLAVCLSVGALFLFFGLTFPRQVMGLYTEDPAVRQAAAEYLTILSGAFLPMAGPPCSLPCSAARNKPAAPLAAWRLRF